MVYLLFLNLRENKIVSVEKHEDAKWGDNFDAKKELQLNTLPFLDDEIGFNFLDLSLFAFFP